MHEISPVLGALEKNIFEHISLMAQEQLEVEFREEIAQLMQMQQMDATKCAMPQASSAVCNNTD